MPWIMRLPQRRSPDTSRSPASDAGHLSAANRSSILTGPDGVKPLITAPVQAIGSRDPTRGDTMSDPSNTQGTPGPDEEADVASGGAPEEPDDVLEEETTDE